MSQNKNKTIEDAVTDALTVSNRTFEGSNLSVIFNNIGETGSPVGYNFHYKNGTHCAYCKRLLSEFGKTIDHIIPKSFGKKYRYNRKNWIACCRTCNHLKGFGHAKHFAKLAECLKIRESAIFKVIFIISKKRSMESL